MNHQLMMLLEAQQRVIEAITQEAVLNALYQYIRALCDTCQVNYWPTPDNTALRNLPLLVQKAFSQKSVQLDDTGCIVVIPVTVDEMCYALLEVVSAIPLAMPTLAAIHAQVALALHRLEQIPNTLPSQMYKRLVDHSNVPIAIYDVNHDNELIFLNNAGLKLYGFSSMQDIYHQPVDALYISAEEKRMVDELVRREGISEGWTGQVTHRNVAGEHLPIRQSLFALSPQGATQDVHYGMIMQDISEQRWLMRSLERQARRLHAAAEVGKATISEFALRPLLESTAHTIQTMFNLEYVSVFIIENEVLKMKVVCSDFGIQSDNIIDNFALIDHSTLLGEAVLTGSPVLVHSEQNEPRLNLIPMLGQDSFSEMVVPLRQGEKVIGVLNMASVYNDTFTDEDQDTFQGLADQLALAINNITLFETERLRNRELLVLTEISRLLAIASSRLSSAWPLIYQQLGLLFNLSAFQIMHCDTNTGIVEVLYSSEPEQRYSKFSLNGLVEQVVHTKKLLQVSKVSPEQTNVYVQEFTILPQHLYSPTYAWLGIPLTTRAGDVIGIMVMQSRNAHAFNFSAEQFLSTVATQVSMAIENTNLVSQLKSTASKLQERTRRLEWLYNLATLIASSLDRNYILQQAAEQIVALFDVDHCGISLVHRSQKYAELVAEYPLMFQERMQFPLNSAVVSRVETARDIVVFKTHEVELEAWREQLEAKGIHTMVLMRLVIGDKLVGSIGLDLIKRTHPLSESELELCRTLTMQLALALENANLYADALEANHLKSQFLANVSHELRTPLNSIIGYTDLLLNDMYGTLNDKQRDRLVRVQSNSQNLLNLINDVLDLSKIEAGHLNLTLEPIYIDEVVHGVINTISPLVETKNLMLLNKVEPGLPSFMADPVRLRQIVVNLVSNAVKFTHQGQIIISAQRAHVKAGSQPKWLPKQLTLAPGLWILVKIEDTGIGIDPEHFALIFDAFRQVDGTTKRKYEGTGLGLAITKQLVEMHGGKIWVDSTLNAGSTFTFVIPVQLPTLKRQYTD